ncbi:MAG: cupredoxin family copper-binding protein [Gemmatimonadota bacterium]|nr:cupredoxin family copper-binding protein [Gemmatimonadota bacterium]
MLTVRRTLVISVISMGALSGAAEAQSLLDRSPNLSGGWVGGSGTLHFNFLHRFSESGAPTRKVTSSPTLFVAVGLPLQSLIGFDYATNSDVASRYPNEWEFFARVAPITQQTTGIADISVQGGYNLAARSADGELSLHRELGPFHLLTAARGFSNAFDLGMARYAIAGGATLHLGRFIALAGDVGTLLNRKKGEDLAWSGALQLAIPYTPHTLSLQTSNTNTASLEGASRGGRRRYGFEFTIPITLRRYFPRRAAAAPNSVPPPVTPVPSRPAAPTPPATPADSARADTARAPVDSTVRLPVAVTLPESRPVPTAPPRPVRRAPARVAMRQLAFRPARIEIERGAAVVWKNDDQLQHTVTATDGSWDSGLIEPGASWRRVFERAGTYAFHCTPHPFMKGVIVVR